MIPFTFPPWTYRGENGKYAGGLYEEFYSQVGYMAGYDMEFVPILDPDYLGDFTGITTKMVGAGDLDMGWINPQGFELVEGFRYTPSMVDTAFVVMTRQTRMPADMWQVFQPFEPDLWLSIVAGVFFGAAVLAVLTKIESGESCLKVLRGFPAFVYHTTATLLDGDEYDSYHSPPAGRVYRVGLLFFVLVCGATYTANLAAFLSKPLSKVEGPRTMEELKGSKACVRWPQTAQAVSAFVGEMLLPPPELVAKNEQPAWSREKLMNGECECIIEVDVMAKLESLQFCDTLHVNPDIKFGHGSVLTVIRDSDAELAFNLSKAMLEFRFSERYSSLIRTALGYGASCNAQDKDDAVAPRITVYQMSAVFIIFGGCSVLSIAMTLFHKMFDKEQPPRKDETELPATDASAGLDGASTKLDSAKLDAILAKLDRALEHSCN